MKEVDSWMGHWLVSVGMLSHGMTFNLVSAKVCSPAKAAMHISLNQLLYVFLLYVFLLNGALPIDSYVSINFTDT